MFNALLVWNYWSKDKACTTGMFYRSSSFLVRDDYGEASMGDISSLITYKPSLGIPINLGG